MTEPDEDPRALAAWAADETPDFPGLLGRPPVRSVLLGHVEKEDEESLGRSVRECQAAVERLRAADTPPRFERLRSAHIKTVEAIMRLHKTMLLVMYLDAGRWNATGCFEVAGLLQGLVDDVAARTARMNSEMRRAYGRDGFSDDAAEGQHPPDAAGADAVVGRL